MLQKSLKLHVCFIFVAHPPPKKWLLHPSILGGFQDGLAFRYLVLLPDHVFSFCLQKIWSLYHFIAGAIVSSFRSDLIYHLMVQPC